MNCNENDRMNLTVNTMPKLPAPTQQHIFEIADDHESGATALLLAAAEALRQLCEDSTIADTQIRGVLAEAARQLVAAQPSMAPMFNLANAVLLAAEAADAPEKVRELMHSACGAFIADNQEAEAILQKKAVGIIRNGDIVLTHSCSSAVRKCLLQATASGKAVEVICTESRPRNEGVVLARELGRAKIPTRLIPDACAGLFMPEANLVLVGVDTIFDGGIVNKAGTSLIALAAQAHGIDIYALATTIKYFASALALPAQHARDPGEVLKEAPANVQPVNFYFDVTPMNLWTGIVTENGVMKPQKVLQKLHAMRVHPELQALLNQRG